ncbi:hypothetical protein MN608_03822 [Microdochium nivale]|nr:hypothetical protein MN608_03822 [Microdochium nivale]
MPRNTGIQVTSRAVVSRPYFRLLARRLPQRALALGQQYDKLLQVVQSQLQQAHFRRASTQPPQALDQKQLAPVTCVDLLWCHGMFKIRQCLSCAISPTQPAHSCTLVRPGFPRLPNLQV